jgi:hypothetical protein
MIGYEPMVWVFYQRHAAIERGTRPDAKGGKPCHGTNTLKAALVHTSRVWKSPHIRGMTLFTWQTTTSTPPARLRFELRRRAALRRQSDVREV